MKNFFKEFKEFITKGNIIDMAVGVVIGGSFGKIVTGLVENIINPFVGLFMNSGDLANWKTVMEEAVLDPKTGEVVTPEVAFMWGAWIQTIIDFIITAFCIFLVLRVIMKVKNKLDAAKIAEEEKKAAEEKAKADAELEAVKARQAQLEESTLNQEKLLKDIKDILSKK
ncbi:MAG: large conductance mechanosensitive channel protein MscL [Ruminococcaceae bacterium]|nr:large conductance mechanosensitive channel protein MscL [Oscillospiraceae bacterium]